MKKTHTLILMPLLTMLWFSGYADESTNEREEAHYARINPVITQLSEIEKAMQMYAMFNNGKLPASLDKLTQSIGDEKNYPPILEEKNLLLDPWGEPIGYELDDRKFVLFSSGPDKKVGTKDDIVRGRPESYVESWKARQAQLLESQGTNAVQEATSPSHVTEGRGDFSPPARSVSKDEPQPEPDENKNMPWRLPLLIGVVVLGGVVTAWRCLNNKKKT